MPQCIMQFLVDWMINTFQLLFNWCSFIHSIWLGLFWILFCICYNHIPSINFLELYLSILISTRSFQVYNLTFILTKHLLDYLCFTFCTSLKCFLWSESLSTLGFNNLDVSFTFLPYSLHPSLVGVASFLMDS